MCIDCDEDEGSGSSPLRITKDLVHLTQQIALDLPGEPVSEDAWCVFFGKRGGAIVWHDYERMARCRDAALLIMSMHAGKA